MSPSQFQFNQSQTTTEVSTDIQTNLDKLDTYFKYLHSVKNPEAILNDQFCSEIIDYFNELTYTDILRVCLLKVNPCDKYQFHFILTDLLRFGFSICVEYVKDPDQASEFQKSVFKNVAALFNLSWYIADMSTQFYCRFRHANGLQVLKCYISSGEFIEKCIKHKSRFEVKRGKRFILKSIMHTFHSITRDTSTTHAEWEKMGMIELLKNTKEFFSEVDEDLRVATLLTWVNVASEDIIEKYDFSRFQLPLTLVEHLNKALKAIVTKENLYRGKIYMDDSTVKEAAIVIVDLENMNFEYNIVDLLEAMYKMSINDNVKTRLYNEFEVKVVLKGIITYGNDFEREHASKCLWQLCFDETIMSEVAQDNEFLGFVKELCSSLNNGQENEALKRNLKGILWMKDKLEKKNDKESLMKATVLKHEHTEVVTDQRLGKDLHPTDAFIENKINQDDKHIMISYNSDGRKLCLKVKQELERLGHSVWIDVEAISGSSLESMANAVENAKCVLVCKLFY
jgi:hypothetical protein